jgi:hypothetical protein
MSASITNQMASLSIQEDQAHQHQDEQQQAQEANETTTTTSVPSTPVDYPATKQPLQESWTLWFHNPQGKSDKNYFNYLQNVYTFGFVSA